MFTFTTDSETVTPDDVAGFFDGWPDPPSSATAVDLLRNSDHVVVARNDEGDVIGFVAALSDGILSAYISLLEVIPAYRRRGVGSELVRRILAEIGPLYMVDAMCDPDVVTFYSGLGFSEATGVSIRRYELQSGPQRPRLRIQ